jgi:TolB-like protein/Flp pilus assembly protein TadD
MQKPPSIAVLPFANASADAENEYFCDGLAEELLNALAKIDALKVAARTSAFSFKGRNVNIDEIRRALHVDTVLEGTVRKSGNRLRITVQLVDALNGYHLWSERYDREMKDIFDVQDEIALAVVNALKLKLLGPEKMAVLKRGTDDPDAYERYLRGLFYWNKRTAENLKRAIVKFQQAADIDPTYTLAYVGLADCYALLEEFAGIPSSETLPKARDAALRALQIDDSLAEAHTSLGFINMNSWQFQEAEKEFKRGIELNPNYPTAHHWYSEYLISMGRMDEAMAEIKRAQQLDPLSPIISINVGRLHDLKSNLDAAVTEYEKVIELNPNVPLAHDLLGLAYLKQGREQEAIAELQRGVELSGRASEELGRLGYGYGALRKRDKAMAVLKELEERHARQESPAMYLAAVYAGLGDKDQAFAWLERDFQAHTGLLTFITLLPDYDTLRDDPRYTDLLRRMGLR